MVQTKELTLNEYPEGAPEEKHFSINEIELPELADGDMLLQTLYVSVDPYQRARMKNLKKHYFPPFAIGKPMDNSVVVRVAESKNPDFQSGDVLTAFLPYREYNILKAEDVKKSNVQNVTKYVKDGADPKKFLSCLGMVGMTAYFGLLELGEPKEGQTVLVSGAAGAVGSIVGQIAKIKGCRVVGVAGSEEKIKWITQDLGFDAAINYKTAKNLTEAIEKECPDGVDVYFDNVGSYMLEAALNNMNTFGRIVACGAISTYNDKKPTPGPSNLFLIVARQIRMEGFLVGRWADRMSEAFEALLKWTGEGKLQTRETVFEGFDKIPEAFMGLFTGKNTGKMIIKV